jgi:DNA-binding CsgD family transcriptional regulator
MPTKSVHGRHQMMLLALNQRANSLEVRLQFLRRALLYCFGLTVGKIEQYKLNPPCFYWSSGKTSLSMEILGGKLTRRIQQELEQIAPNVLQMIQDADYLSAARIIEQIDISINKPDLHQAPSLKKILTCKKMYDMSEQQARIACWIMHGFEIKQIAHYLSLSPSTVKSHLNAWYKKFGVNKRMSFIAELNKGVLAWIR